MERYSFRDGLSCPGNDADRSKPSDTAKARARQTYRESPTTENI